MYNINACKTMYNVNLCKIYIKSICTNCCLFTKFKKVCDITGRLIARGVQGHVHPPFTLKGRARWGHTFRDKKEENEKKKWRKRKRKERMRGENWHKIKIVNFYFYPVLLNERDHIIFLYFERLILFPSFIR